MLLTAYPHVNRLLDQLLMELQQILSADLMGLYLYGSLVTGDFDAECSDIDLLAVTAAPLTETQFAALQHMQAGLIGLYPAWDDRLEIAYVSQTALKTFRTQSSLIAIVSPGEPFHWREADQDWLVNWYIVREQGLTLYGPGPDTLIDPINRTEFVEIIKKHIISWPAWLGDSHELPFLAYAILTVCRGLYACETGQQTSKVRAAQWAQARYPAWAALIQQALVWRQNGPDDQTDRGAVLAATRRFIDFAVEQIAPAV
jgi:predicted nucleotidyltransferase